MIMQFKLNLIPLQTNLPDTCRVGNESRLRGKVMRLVLKIAFIFQGTIAAKLLNGITTIRSLIE